MDKYENRRLKLIELKDNFCNGKISTLAEKLGKDQSYVGRMLYPEGKAGKKRIGDDMLDVISQVFQIPKSWFDGDINIQNDFGSHNQFGNSNNFGVIQNSGSLQNDEPHCQMNDDGFAPHIPTGSDIWLDTQMADMIDGKMYLVECGGVKSIRRVFRQPENDAVLLSTDNALFPNRTVAADKVNILGRVVAWKVTEK